MLHLCITTALSGSRGCGQFPLQRPMCSFVPRCETVFEKLKDQSMEFIAMCISQTVVKDVISMMHFSLPNIPAVPPCAKGGHQLRLVMWKRSCNKDPFVAAMAATESSPLQGSHCFLVVETLQCIAVTQEDVFRFCTTSNSPANRLLKNMTCLKCHKLATKMFFTNKF